ncbi:MAG: response regulator [Desulfobacterales bacterium]|nr:MAG: response regulator [Desulfobacterales bacterium]
MNRLLLIDDERPILETLETSLTSEGYDVMTAETSKEGLRIFEEEGIKLILTDIKMPGIDGIEVLKKVKAIDEEAEVIVITGHGDMDTAIAALQYGASDFITKPIRDEVLLLALERAKKTLAMSQQLRSYTEHLEQKVEEHRLELRQAQEELIRNERLATIGETVAGLAHYIKNVVTALQGGMHMVERGMPRHRPQMFEEGWAMVQRHVGKVSDLALALLRYSKERTPERSICRPNDIVSEVVELFKDTAEEHHVKLETVLDPNLTEAYLDRDGIHRVLVNLVSNGIDGCIYDTDTSKGWSVIVKTRIETNTESAETIVFEVTDNGCGMTDEVKQKLFSRFFSTKAGRGTGLGLLITQKIIHEHGGEISVKSKAGRGTTFSVRFNQYMPNVSPRAICYASEREHRLRAQMEKALPRTLQTLQSVKKTDSNV